MAEKKEPENTPNKEDRNIAEVDVETPGLTPEEQLILFWDKYKKTLISATLIVLAGSIAWFGKKSMDGQKLRSIQEAYQNATIADQEAQNQREDSGNFDEKKDLASLENTLAFAEKHSGHPLSGHARLKAGHAYFKVGNFQESIAHYNAAAKVLSKSPELGGLASLYEAIATLRSGDREHGKSLLTKVAQNQNFLHEHRGEAYFKLGVIALSEKKHADYNRWETALENASLDHAQTTWLDQLKAFRSQFPKDGFDTLGPIPPKEVPPAPIPTSVTGNSSATGNTSPTGN